MKKQSLMSALHPTLRGTWLLVWALFFSMQVSAQIFSTHSFRKDSAYVNAPFRVRPSISLDGVNIGLQQKGGGTIMPLYGGRSELSLYLGKKYRIPIIASLGYTHAKNHRTPLKNGVERVSMVNLGVELPVVGCDFPHSELDFNVGLHGVHSHIGIKENSAINRWSVMGRLSLSYIIDLRNKERVGIGAYWERGRYVGHQDTSDVLQLKSHKGLGLRLTFYF